MSKRLRQAAVVFIVLFAAAQLIRPDRTNPPTDTSRTIQAQVGTASGLATVLDRSCRDCHSNNTVWSSWHTQIAPLSWLMAHEVAEGRKALNFSEWVAYSAAQQRMLLAASCDDAKSGKMPGPYTFFKPETRVSAQDVETICAAARETEAKAAGASR
jgi:Haem-binding domain